MSFSLVSGGVIVFNLILVGIYCFLGITISYEAMIWNLVLPINLISIFAIFVMSVLIDKCRWNLILAIIYMLLGLFNCSIGGFNTTSPIETTNYFILLCLGIIQVLSSGYFLRYAIQQTDKAVEAKVKEVSPA